jgi:creatinine amidohydrolase
MPSSVRVSKRAVRSSQFSLRHPFGMATRHTIWSSGTLSVQRETLLAILSDVADAAIDNGVDACLLVNAHGGNRPALGCSVSEIGETHPDVSVSGLTCFELVGDFVDDNPGERCRRYGPQRQVRDLTEVTLLPRSGRTDHLKGNPIDDPTDRGPRDLFENGELSTYRLFEEYSESGAFG